MSSLPEPPPEFLCPITLDLMRDPVAAPTGITYDRAAITSWLLACGQRTCPMTHAELRAEDLVPNHTLRRLIQSWRAAHRCASRVAVVPATPEEEAAVAELEGAARAGDAERCAAAARWLRRMASLSEPNRSRLASAGAARALAAAFASFADAEAADAAVLGFVIEALALFVPVDDEEAIVAVGSSSASVARLVAIAANGNQQTRHQAVVVIREIISLSFHRYGAGAIDLRADHIDAIIQVLVKTIRDNVSPQATRACLVAAYQLACGDESAAATLAAAGLVALALELLVDADRSTTEKALAALDATLASGDGRASARAHALAVPVLVNKFFWVSDEATELVLSALLRICKECPDEVGGTTATARRLAIIEALAGGALRKVILVLQAQYRRETKDKATQLLRLLVRYKDSGVVCTDPMDLRGIKRGTTILTT